MSDSTPICRCRVLYLGSSVPQVTKDGLQGIQEPLQELYPEQGAIGARGIDSWLSVWSNGILLENVDENHKKITRFFPIDSLHYCAAIRYVLVPEKNTLHTPTPRFLPLDSPFARAPNPAHPPLFAAILRRTSGIKVLECHSFICKREVAANALVRCCFHAYADSSYAKQVEGNSVYGTLNSERETKEKVEDWKIGPRSQSGSTMTINSVGNTKDDVSIYNGDENHKVWAGSQDNLDSIYDVYSTSTLNRPQRPRQVAQPVPVPPPPAPKEKPKKSKSKKSHKEDIYMNGYGKANSISGTMMHPKNRGHIHQGGPQPMYIMSPHHGHPLNASTTLPNPKFFKYHGNTYSHRQNSKKLLIPARPIPPPFVPIGNLGPGGHGPVGHGPGGHASHGPVNHGPVGHPGHVGHGPVGHVSHLGPGGPMGQILMPSPTTLNKKTKKNKHHHSQINLALEEPIYLPSPRTPNAAPIPIPDAYFSHHGNQVYATMESPRSSGTKQKKDKHVQNGHVNGKLDKETAKLLMMRDKKFAKSMNGLDHAEEPPVNLAEESPFNTGIYRKKGHLNERAFSYSIRQEHRSRSYGSLANLKFASSIPNGVNEMEDTREDIKKEREIMQMVQDLDLSGDEIERSEVPRGMYDNRAMPPALGGPTVIVNGNRGHRR